MSYIEEKTYGIRALQLRGCLTVLAPRMYDNGFVKLSVRGGCGCKKMLRAVESKTAGLLIDVTSKNRTRNPRIVFGAERARWCPFCGKALRLADPTYAVLRERQ